MSGSSVRRFSDGSSKTVGAEGVVPVPLVVKWINSLLAIGGHEEASIPDTVNSIASLADQMEVIQRILGAPDPDSEMDAALGPAAMQMAVKNRRTKTRQLAVALKEKARMAANPKGTAAIRDAALKTVGLR